MPDYEVVPEEEAGQISRRRRAKPRMPTFTIERYGGRLIYFWFGMRFGVLMKLFKRGRFSFTLNCIPDTLLLFLWVPWNSRALLDLRGEIPEARGGGAARASRRSSSSAIGAPAPRCLHDLFSVDPNLAYPTTFECFFPHHFLLTEEVLSKVMRGLLPKKRPQDDVPVGFDRPQEEEFAMMMLGEGTPYITHAWPRFGPADTEYLDFKGVLRRRPERNGPMPICGFIAGSCSSMRGKRLVMKTPANAARLKLLTKLFPDARYVYLARNPLEVFPSTVKLWRALYSTQGLHNPPNLDPWLDDYVLDMFARLTEDYEEDKHLIPKDRLVEMRYEDFVKDPVASMRDIYQRLDIPNFAQAEAPMREFLGERSEHKVSRYELPPALKRKVIDRLKPYIDRFGYRAAVEASPAGTRGEVAGARARAVLGLPKRRVGTAGPHTLPRERSSFGTRWLGPRPPPRPSHR